MEKTIVKASALVVLLGSLSMPLHATDLDDNHASMQQNILALKGIPEEVERGSINVDEDSMSESQMAQYAAVKIDEAINIARKSVGGKVIQAKLDDEDDFLIWDVEVMLPSSRQIIELKIDAGNGKLLAAKQDATGHWWQLWEL